MIDSTLKNGNILIVDDQESNIVLLEGFLTMQGYLNIKTTTDPREVVHLFASFNPDLILLDLSMPFLTGFEVMEQLKSRIPASTYLPILILTADATTEAKQHALSGGASDFLTKPFDLIEVSLRIRNLLYTSYLQQQLQNQNQILEKKVKERTYEIEKKNRELIAAKEKVEASDHLKTAFMNNISHEVRTPLNGILGFGALLANPDLLAEQKQEYISVLEVSSNRLLNTITDYVDISLIASGNMEVNSRVVNVNNTLEELKNQFQKQCDAKGLTLNFIIPKDRREFTIQTDPNLLLKIISHLVDNAIKFSNQGTITVGYSVESSRIGFFVKDTGIGIAKEAQERVFESFMQEDVSNTRGHEGSGLGLSIVKGLLNLLGGKIRLESVKGEGSTFFITLPINTSVAGNVETSKVNVEHTANKLPVILIAEDDYANRIFMETILEEHASLIYHAENGSEAVDLCHKHPEISIVLMDIKMPVMNGLEATRKIKSFRKNLPIIAITAYAMSGDESKAFEAGCDDYLTKPASKEKLLGKIKNYGFTT